MIYSKQNSVSLHMCQWINMTPVPVCVLGLLIKLSLIIAVFSVSKNQTNFLFILVHQ